MNKKTKIITAGISSIIITSAAVWMYVSQRTSVNNHPLQTTPSSDSTLTIANWNLQVFGMAKARDESLVERVVDIINDYDIVFVQEIRDASGNAVSSLAEKMTNYQYRVSSRAGRTSSKEQYCVFYRNGITLNGFRDFNPDAEDRWERPPIESDFSFNNYTFKVYNLHAKPSDVTRELKALENLVKTNGNVMIIGDLNADGAYYNNSKNTEFDSWNWLIKDEEDTTTKSTSYAYDRIIVNLDLSRECITNSIDRRITPDLSDHYLIWVRIFPNEH